MRGILRTLVLTIAGLTLAGCGGTSTSAPNGTTSVPSGSSARAGSSPTAAGAPATQASSPSPAPGTGESLAANAETQMQLNACWPGGAMETGARAQAQYERAQMWLREREQPGAASSLARSQRLWEQYRDAACEAAAAVYEGGTVAVTQRSHCLATQN